MTEITATSLCDAAGVKIASGTAYFTPCKPDGSPLPGFRRGDGGQAGGTQKAVSFPVTEGVLAASLADSANTTPLNVAYRFEVKDPGGALLIGPYILQVSGPIFNLDDYEPTLVPLPLIQTGPPGPANSLAIGTVTTGSPSASITGSAPNQTLNLVLPTAAPNSLAIGTVTQGTAAATITGSAPNQTLNLTLPQGAKGNPGDVSGPQLAAVKGATTSPTDNFFNAAGISANNYIDYTNGTIHAFSGFTATPYMLANAGGQMVCNQNIINQSPSGIAFFDVNLAYISGIGTGIAAGTPFAVPANAVYVRFSVKNSDFNAATMMVVWGSTVPSSYVSYSKASIAELTAAVSTLNATITATASATVSTAVSNSTAALQAVNRLNPSAVTALKYINPSNGTVGSVSSGFEQYGVSDYIPVVGGGQVTMNFGLPSIGSGVGLAFYNGTTYISGVGTASALPAGVPIAVPATATAMRTTLVTANASSLMVCQGGVLPSQFVSYGNSVFSAGVIPIVDPRIASAIAAAISTVGQPLLGKKYAVIGDSITQQGLWQPILEAKTGMVKVYQNARSGRPISHAFDDYTGTGSTFVDNGDIAGYVGCTVGNTFVQDLAAAAPDVLFVELGTNDGDTPTGTQASINDYSTWWGRVNSVVTGVAAARPGMKIVYITPYQINPAAYSAKWDSTAPAKLADMVTAVKYICGLFGSTVVDMLHDSGINQYNWTTLLQDGIHINTTGATYGFVPPLIARLRTIFA